MHDADSRRDELESFERLLSPFEKLVTLPVAFELHVQIELQRARRTEEIDLHGVIDHQIDRHERFNDFRIAAQPRDCAAHRGKIDNQRHTGEILQNDARDDEWNFLVRGDFAFQFASVSTSLRRTFFPSQLRSTDSSTIRMLTGNREIFPMPCSSSAGSE